MASLALTSLLLLLSTPLLVSAGLCNKDDKKALLAIKSAFNNNYHFASWTTSSACCDWDDVTCDSTTSRVTALTIVADNNLPGTIPPAVGDLPFLTILLFHHLALLTGSIPSSVTKLTRLSVLNLSNNALSGPIPAFLSQLNSLNYLSLDFNKLSGSIPPELAKLSNLVELHLDHNSLSGLIPTSFGNFPTSSPPGLYLSHNNLTGSIPTSLGVPEWVTVDFSRNHLSGDASVLFRATKPTTTIDLSRNQFAFDLTHVAFPVNLTLLDLNHNLIYGAIPAQVNQLADVELFNVSYNRLCGQIPVGVVTAKFDQYEYWHNKCLCGAPLATCLGDH